MFLLHGHVAGIPAVADFHQCLLQQFEADDFRRIIGECLVKNEFGPAFIEAQAGVDPRPAQFDDCVAQFDARIGGRRLVHMTQRRHLQWIAPLGL